MIANSSITTKYAFIQTNGLEFDFDIMKPSRDFTYMIHQYGTENPLPEASAPASVPLAFFGIDTATLTAKPDYNCVLRYFVDPTQLPSGVTLNSIKITHYMGEKNGYRIFLDEQQYTDSIANYVSQGTSTETKLGISPTFTYIGIFGGAAVEQPPIDLGNNQFDDVLHVEPNTPVDFVFDLPSRPSATAQQRQLLELSIVGATKAFNFSMTYLGTTNPASIAPQTQALYFFRLNILSTVASGEDPPQFNAAVRYKYDTYMIPNSVESTITFYLMKQLNQWTDFNIDPDRNFATNYITQGTAGGVVNSDLFGGQEFVLGLFSDYKSGNPPPPPASSSPSSPPPSGSGSTNPKPSSSSPPTEHSVSASTSSTGPQTSQSAKPSTSKSTKPQTSGGTDVPRGSDTKTNTATGYNIQLWTAALCLTATLYVFMLNRQ